MSQRERRRRRLEALVHAALTIAGRRMEELFAVPPEQRPPDGLRALAADTARPLVQMLADELPLTGDDVEVIVETLVFGMLTWMVLALQAQVTLLVTSSAGIVEHLQRLQRELAQNIAAGATGGAGGGEPAK